MATVRAWSTPYARSLFIAEGTIVTSEGAGRAVSLPIGLLGHTSDLAALEEWMMKIALAALAAVSLGLGAPVAHAENLAHAENPLAKDSVTLRLSGLDLSTPDGQQRLAIRLDQAAAAVCGDRLAGVHLVLE
ncbi:hypothetical protein E4T56_gene14253, partial [Termitomyces sp. T112]